MKKLALLAVASCLVPASPAAAENTRDYFLAHAVNEQAPDQLSREEQAYYDRVFTAIEEEQWSQAEQLLASRQPGLLHDVARAELYLAANSPRVELEQLQDWLRTGRSLPHAAQLGRLAVTRGAEALPDLPREHAFVPRGGIPKRVRPDTVDDGTMPAEIRSAILDAISSDDPDRARQLLDGVNAGLSPQARAEWRQRVAWSYYIENMDPQAAALAKTVSAGSGPWVAEGEWVLGLASWRMSDCRTARDAFERAAYGAVNPELRAASFYWGSRSALRCRQPDLADDLLTSAAGNDQTLYGMLAAEQLGRRLPDRVASADLSRDDWNRIGSIPNVRKAVALAEIGRDVLASEVLLHQARIGATSDYAALSRLARALGFTQTQLYMAYNSPDGGLADPAAHFPVPKWAPVTGWKVDPALAYAHTLQESNFRSSAVSPADARGLMQITPITIRELAPRVNMSASQVDIFDPQVNLAFGQANLEMLRDRSETRGALPKIMAAYNAGLTPVTRWNSEIRDQGDPLLYMESIPYWETRGYVAIVTRNYWMYERQAGAQSPSRIALAQNQWPGFPATREDSDGRVYLEAVLD